MPEDEEEVDGGGDGAKREETRKRGTTREKERDRCGREKKMERSERKRGVGGAVGRQSVEVTGLWSRRDMASSGGGEERRWRRTAVSRPRGK